MSAANDKEQSAIELAQKILEDTAEEIEQSCDTCAHRGPNPDNCPKECLPYYEYPGWVPLSQNTTAILAEALLEMSKKTKAIRQRLLDVLGNQPEISTENLLEQLIAELEAGENERDGLRAQVTDLTTKLTRQKLRTKIAGQK